MKLCKDCKHCEPVVTKVLWMNSVDYQYAKCKSSKSINLVDGSGGKFCDIERNYDYQTACGREGKLWEAINE